MNCVTWHQAYAFCIWDRGFLPSEAEWNYAASGGGEQRLFPWGNELPTGTAQAIWDCRYGGPACPNVTNIAPVGSALAGNGRFGQADLSGNEWEWNLDSFADYVVPCQDCSSVKDTPLRGIRGGGSVDNLESLSNVYRNKSDSKKRGFNIGFRCARSP